METELSNHYAERGDFINEIIGWQKDYWAKPTTEEVTFPFTGAATIIIPLSAITIEATHSRTMTTLFALEQFVSVKPMHADYSEITRPLERFLDHELINNIKIYNPLNDAVLELTKYGTGIIKCGFTRIVKYAMRPKLDDEGVETEEEEEFSVVVKNGATVDAVPLSRFIMPFAYQVANDAPWCGEEHEGSIYEIRQLENSGMFPEGTTDKIIGHFTATATLDKVQENQSELESRKPIPMTPSNIQWFEIWLAFDVERKRALTKEYGAEAFPPGGEDKEIVVHYHRDSRTIMSVRYNWHNDLRRAYYKGVYFPVEHRWAGLGACKQLEQFQKEITTQHRQRLDNATLANVRMIKVSSMSQYGPNEPIFPGKIWFLDNMDDVETFQLGEIYPSAYSNEHQTLQYAQQRSGVNELNLGMPNVGTPGTATAELSRVQESNKRFDFIYKNVRRLTGDVVLDVAAQIQQFGPKNIAYYDSVDNGTEIRDFLTLPVALIREGIIVSIVAAGQQENKLLDRQNWQQVASMIQNYYKSMLELVALTSNPQLIQYVTTQGLTAATEAMKQILESFDLKNINRIVLNEQQIQQAIQSGTQQPPNGGAPSGPQGIGPAQGNGQFALPSR